MPRYWQLALGVLFVLVIVCSEGRRRRRDRRPVRAPRAGLSGMAELLRTEGLTKRFQGLVANDHVDFQLASGELRCVIGPNGAGKTTFISMISGHLRPSAGDIWYRGEHITQLPVPARARRGIGRKFQTPSVFDNLSVLENVELAVLASARRQDASARIARVLRLVRLERPGGHPRPQPLARPAPVAGDRAAARQRGQASAARRADRRHDRRGDRGDRRADPAAGRASCRSRRIIIEHDINFIRSLRAPITVMHLGRVLVEGPFDEIERNAEVREVYLGAEA